MAQDSASLWKSLTPDQRQQALARMTPQQKTNLAAILGYKPAGEAKSADSALTTNRVNPATGTGYGVYSMRAADGSVQPIPYFNVREAARQGFQFADDPDRFRYARDFAADPARPATSYQPTYAESTPEAEAARKSKSVHAATSFLPALGMTAGGLIGAPGVATSAVGAAAGGGLGKIAEEELNEHLAAAPKPDASQEATNLAGSAVTGALSELGGRIPGWLLGKGAKALALAAALRPTTETVEDVAIPQLAGERAPDSTAGILQRVLKKYGAGPQAFRAVEAEQTAGTKEALRRGLQRASRTPITSIEPPEAAAQAVTGLESRARPLYSQLAASRVGIPFDQTALGSGPEDAAWRRAVTKLKVPDSTLRYPNKPLYLLQEYRGELQKIAMGAQGTVEGHLAQEARKDLDAGIEKALATADPRLLRSWKTANALWARARAIDDLRGELLKVTKGTAPAAQSLQSGAAAVPTEIQGSSLVERLKKLDEGSHDLSRSFPDGGKAIRAIADLLDKAQKTKTADPSLFPWSRVLRYGAALVGTTGGATLAALSATHSSKGHPAVATFAAAAVLAFVGERYGEKAIVAMMTDKEAAATLQHLATSNTIPEVEKWAQRLKTYLPGAARLAVTTGSLPGNGAENKGLPQQ